MLKTIVLLKNSPNTLCISDQLTLQNKSSCLYCSYWPLSFRVAIAVICGRAIVRHDHLSDNSWYVWQEPSEGSCTRRKFVAETLMSADGFKVWITWHLENDLILLSFPLGPSQCLQFQFIGFFLLTLHQKLFSWILWLNLFFPNQCTGYNHWVSGSCQWQSNKSQHN